MRIAQIAPLYEAVPPLAYGGTERVIAALCDGLVRRGHDVTLFAAGSSHTNAKLVEATPAPLRVRMTRREMVDVAPHLHLRMLAEVYARNAEFDIIHSHADVWTLPFAAHAAAPTIITMHGRLDVDHVREVLPLYPGIGLVAISDHQRSALSGLGVGWAARVHNGLSLDRYFGTTRNDMGHLVFVGRIHPEKGPLVAVEVARRTGFPLHVAAKIDPLDVEYFEAEVEDHFTRNDVRFVGELAEPEKPAFYAAATATLFPSDWPEPFGLVMIESMAAGTPVIALRRGAVPEIVVHGVTGFICDTVDEMVAAVARVQDIDPDACRARAAAFDADTMSRAYEQVYEATVAHVRRTSVPS